MTSRLVRLFILVAALQVLPQGLAAEEFVQITGDKVNIRFGPSTGARIVAQAKRGDVFEHYKTLGEWYGIFMFTGHSRYVHRSLAKVVDYSPVLPEEQIRYRVFLAIVNAERQSRKDADAEYPLMDHLHREIPGNRDRNTEFKWILRDRYELQIFYDYGLQPPLHGIIGGEGLKKRWLN